MTSSPDNNSNLPAQAEPELSPREKFLVAVEKYAAIFCPISVMADILGVDEQQLRDEIAVRDSDVSRAYRRGKAASKVKILAQEMQLAYIGSPAALEATRESLIAMEDEEG